MQARKSLRSVEMRASNVLACLLLPLAATVSTVSCDNTDWENFNEASKNFAALGSKGTLNIFVTFTSLLQTNSVPIAGSEITCRDENNVELDWISTKHTDDGSVSRKFVPQDDNSLPFSQGQFSNVTNCDVREMLCNTLTQPNALVQNVFHVNINDILGKSQKSTVILLYNLQDSQMLALMSEDPIDVTTVCSPNGPPIRQNTIACASSNVLNSHNPQFSKEISAEGDESIFFKEWEKFNIAADNFAVMARDVYHLLMGGRLAATQRDTIPPCNARKARAVTSVLKCIDANFSQHKWISTTHSEDSAVGSKFIPTADIVTPFPSDDVSVIPTSDVKKMLCNTLTQSGTLVRAVIKVYRFNNLFAYSNKSVSPIGTLLFNSESGDMAWIVSEYPIDVTTACTEDPVIGSNTIVCISGEVFNQ